jgi:hypothetical protein
MDVEMAADASPRDVLRDRAEVVVTAQAGRAAVRALEHMAGLLLVIEGEVLPETVPAIGKVAQGAVRREGLVGNDRPQLAVPLVARSPGAATVGHDGRGADEQDEDSEGSGFNAT